MTAALVLLLATGAVGQPVAAHAVDAAVRFESPAYAEDELVDLVEPFAFYPDELLDTVLPATTHPLQLIQAAWLLDALDEDPTLEPDLEWEESVIALLAYPQALRALNEDLDRTRRLGEAVRAAEPAVLAAIQDVRARALRAGTLRSDADQLVVRDDDGIRILVTDPEVVHVPYEEPQHVVVYSTVPVYHGPPRRYRSYHHPLPPDRVAAPVRFWSLSPALAAGWHGDDVRRDGYHGRPLHGRGTAVARIGRPPSARPDRSRRAAVVPARGVESSRARGPRAGGGPVPRRAVAPGRRAGGEAAQRPVRTRSPGRVLAAADTRSTGGSGTRRASRRTGSEADRNADRAGSRRQAAGGSKRSRAETRRDTPRTAPDRRRNAGSGKALKRPDTVRPRTVSSQQKAAVAARRRALEAMPPDP